MRNQTISASLIPAENREAHNTIFWSTLQLREADTRIFFALNVHTLCVRFKLKTIESKNDRIERRIGLECIKKHTSYAKFMRLGEFTESHEISQVLFTSQKAVSSNSNYLNDVMTIRTARVCNCNNIHEMWQRAIFANFICTQTN